jgi:multiple sugar transport system substrate-binding protein
VAKLSKRAFLTMVCDLAGGAAALTLLNACGAAAPTPAAAPPPTAPPAPTAAPANPTVAPMAAASAPTPTEAPKPTTVPQPTPAAATAATSRQPFTIVFMQGRGEFSQTEEDTFNAKYAPLKVNMLENDYTRLAAMFASKQPPDVIRTYAPSIPGFKARNLILDLTDRFKASKKINTGDLWEANDYYVFGPDSLSPSHSGLRYGMVKDFAPDNTLWIWKASFDDAKVPLFEYDNPPSYADLLKLAPQLTKKDGTRTVRWGMQPSDFWIDRVTMAMVMEIGKSIYSEDYSKVLIKSDKDVHDAFKWYYDMAFSGGIPTKLNPIDDFVAGLIQGRIAIFQNGYWHTAYLRANEKPETHLDDNSRFIGAPWFFDKSKRLSPTVTAAGDVVAKATKDPDATWTFYEYFMAEDPAVNRAKGGWGIPAYKSWFDQLPNSKPHEQRALATLKQEMPLMKTLNFNPYLGEDSVNQVWSAEIEKALRANTKVDDMLDSVTGQINQLIQEGKDAIG